jgi:hypothetical protein
MGIGSTPSAWAANGTTVGQLAHTLTGIRFIEFGNERAYAHNGTPGAGAQYGVGVANALTAMQGSGKTLLVEGEDALTGSGWVGAMVGAAPALRTRTDVAFTVHPNGQRNASGSPGGGWEPRIVRMISQLNAADILSPPIFITEWGISTDNGVALSDNYGWPTNMTYVAAGNAAASNIPAMFDRFMNLRAVIWYSTQDLRDPGFNNGRENYFGARRLNETDKPGLTERLRELAAAYR